MSQMRRWSGVILLGAGVAVAAYAYRAVVQAEAENETRSRVAAAAALDAAQRMEAETRSVEARAVKAAALQPLNAALENHVDGPTLIDLFEHEDWWQVFREEFAGARVIVGDDLLGAWGKIDLGGADRELVLAARKQRLGSKRTTIGGESYVIVAARMAALPEREPVLVLAKRATVAPVPAAITGAAPSGLRDRRMPLFAGGVLALVGLVLVVTSGAGRGRQAAGTAFVPGTVPTTGTVPAPGTVSAGVPREPTLRFGTPARPLPGADPVTGAPRPPVATGSSVSIPGGSSSRVAAVGSAALPVTEVAPGSAIVEAGTHMESGRQFGRYRLLERLGEGGMSEIFTAEASGVEGFTRTFVLKRLRPELARDKEAVAQFIDEARLQAGLVHSNIVPVFDFGMVGNGEYFMTQEYIMGRDLLRLMTRHKDRTPGGIEARLAYYLAYETLQALAYAHDRHDKGGEPMGIVHRDVSPGNVMISLRGEVKLSDFGIVKANRRISQTQVGMVKGNANFMSPEQARGHSVDARSDLFSLATVLYFCLSGELLYSGENDLDVLYKAARGPTEEDHVLIAALPEPAASILAKALSLDPNERFQTAGEFADQLAAFVGGGKGQAATLMQLLFGDEFRRHAA
jgi:Protein kinase domain